MFNQIDADFRIIAKVRTGQTIKRVGKLHLTIIEESLNDAFVNLYFFALAEFIKQEFEGDVNQLNQLKDYIFHINNICIK